MFYDFLAIGPLMLSLFWLIFRSRSASVAVGVDPATRLMAVWVVLGLLNAGLFFSYQEGERVLLYGMPLMVLGPYFFTIDLLTHRIPNRSTLVLGLLTCLPLLGAVVTLHWGSVFRAFFGSVLVAVILGLAWAAGQLGLGDVKLSISLAAALTAVSWKALGLATVLSFLLAGAVAVFLLIFRKGSWRQRLALGPWLVVGSTVAFYLA